MGGRGRFFAAVAAALSAAASPTAAAGQATQQRVAPPPIMTPFPPGDFHFSDAARDAEYWRLEGEVERSSAVARQTLYEANRALKYPAPAPGSAAWLEARAAVERAIIAERPVRQAQMALIAFATREGPKLSPAEAPYALHIRHVHEESLRGASDNLVRLLAALAGIRTGQLPW